MFLPRFAHQTVAAAPKADAVAKKIEQALAGFSNVRSFNQGVYGYTIRRDRVRGDEEREAMSVFAWSDMEDPAREAEHGDEAVRVTQCPAGVSAAQGPAPRYPPPAHRRLGRVEGPRPWTARG